MYKIDKKIIHRILDSDKKQQPVSQTLGVEGFFPSLLVDLATDPTTYVGAGVLKNVIQKGGRKTVPQIIGALNKTTPGGGDMFQQIKLIADANPSGAKRLKVDTYARFKIVDPLRFYQSVRNEIEARKQLDTIVDSALREELGLRGLKEILSEQRNSITKNIRDQVNIKARTLGMEIIDIQIRRADYPEVTSQAIFARMISERERIAREFRATGEEEAQKIRASAEKQRVVTVADGARQSQEIRGAGDAEAIRIYAESFGQDPEFFSFYRSMEAYKKSFNQDDTMVINPTGDFFKFFELPSN